MITDHLDLPATKVPSAFPDHREATASLDNADSKVCMVKREMKVHAVSQEQLDPEVYKVSPDLLDLKVTPVMLALSARRDFQDLVDHPDPLVLTDQPDLLVPLANLETSVRRESPDLPELLEALARLVAWDLKENRVRRETADHLVSRELLDREAPVETTVPRDTSDPREHLESPESLDHPDLPATMDILETLDQPDLRERRDHPDQWARPDLQEAQADADNPDHPDRKDAWARRARREKAVPLALLETAAHQDHRDLPERTVSKEDRACPDPLDHLVWPVLLDLRDLSDPWVLKV